MSKKRILTFSIVIVLIMAFSFHLSADAKSKRMSPPANPVKNEMQQAESKEAISAQSQADFLHSGDFMEASEIHMVRVFCAVGVLTLAFFFCILLARKNGLFFLKEKKEPEDPKKEMSLKELASEL